MQTFCYNLGGNMTLWTNTAFTRVWRVGGRYFGVTKAGVFELTGNDDNGTPFVSTFVTSKNILGINSLKRIYYARLNVDGAGTAAIILDGDSGGEAIEFTVSERVKFGRGSRGRAVALQVQSTADGFTLHSIELSLTVMQRGVR